MARARRRRVKGEGSIYQRGDGIWCASYVFDIGGIKKRRVVYGRTKTEASENLGEMRRTGAGASSKMSVADLLTEWQANVKDTRRASTATRYEAIARVHVTPLIGGARIGALTPEGIREFDAMLVRAKTTPPSRKAARLILSSAMRWAVKRELIARNPCELVDAPSHRARVVTALSIEQARSFAAKAVHERLGAMYVLAIATGLRQGELFGLKWSDVDFANSAISVVRTLKETSAGIVEDDTKTSAGRRLVVVPAAALFALKAHHDRPTTAKDGYCFVAQKGGGLRKSVFTRKEWKPFIRRIGMPGLTFHQLRHTAATLRMAAGVHGKVVQETLGHGSIGVTLGTYSHVAPTMQKEAATLVSDLLFGSRPDSQATELATTGE